MTNKEAINTLKILKDYYNDKNEDSYVGFDDKDNEALDIAIKALKQQPSLRDKLEKEYLVESLKEDLQKLYAENEELHKKLEQQPSEDAVSREEVQDLISRWLSDYLLDETREALETINYKVGDMPSVYLKRPKPDMIERIKKAIDEMTEIHSDGEFYIKNVDAKWIIGKYLYGAELSGGGEDGDSN